MGEVESSKGRESANLRRECSDLIGGEIQICEGGKLAHPIRQYSANQIIG